MAIQDAHKEVVKLLCQVESHKLRHEVRNIFAKNLDSIVGYEKEYLTKLQGSMVEYATEQVTSTVSQGGKAVKEDAFKNAISVLSQEASDEEKEDDIAKLFCVHLKEFAEDLEKKAGTVVKLSPTEIKELQGELDALMKRHDLEATKLEAPSEITLGLIK